MATLYQIPSQVQKISEHKHRVRSNKQFSLKQENQQTISDLLSHMLNKLQRNSPAGSRCFNAALAAIRAFGLYNVARRRNGERL